MTRTRMIIACVALAGALTAAVAVPGQARTAGNGPEASAAAIYLTIGEAKREIRGRLRRDARGDGDTITYLEAGPCRRYSARRVRCYFYEEYTGPRGDWRCEGPMQVIEFVDRYRTQGIGVDCD